LTSDGSEPSRISRPSLTPPPSVSMFKELVLRRSYYMVPRAGDLLLVSQPVAISVGDRRVAERPLEHVRTTLGADGLANLLAADLLAVLDAVTVGVGLFGSAP
jgi:hypothetical protein